MRLTIVQTDLVWESPADNCARFERMLAPLSGQTDLVALPEMFTTGFSMNANRLAESMDGPTVHWLREQAARLNAAVLGSFICRDNEHFYNRLLVALPDGALHYYDKRHLFGLGKEDQTYTAGRQRLLFDWKGWRICPLICYDLRFPVWSRQPPNEPPYDLLLYVANWPARRAHHWRTLLPARAVENQCYVAAVNIVGTDGNGLEYQGDSGLWDFGGQAFCMLTYQKGFFTAELSLEALRQYRQQLPFLQDADSFILKPPGLTGGD
ncbi:MAG: amidohydrolase [Saprospiraceae bacterium]|nr:amidohydrolase [Saprospiraceae bacterium]MDW8230645.1 amidohydrolase [Saprospiraceae bacterium]